MNYLCAFLLLFAGQYIYSQNTARVLDKETNIPVSYADIYYPDTKTGTSADSLGYFSMPSGKSGVLVQVSAVNYKTCLEYIKKETDELFIYLEPSCHNLHEITVSANSTKLQGENVSNVVSVSLKDNIEMRGVSLSGQLSQIPGLSNISTGSGIGKPVIRGFGGNRIAVFSQGIRVENQQWGDEHGLGLDKNGYERVEVIKGPSSLLYGSDALGGVLYFVSERYAKDNTAEAALNTEYSGNTEGWRTDGAVKFSSGNFHGNFFGGYATHKDYTDGNGNSVDNSRFNAGDFKTALGYTGGNFTTSLKYNFLKEKYGLTHSEEEEEHEHEHSSGRTPELPYQALTTHIVSSENTLFMNNGSKLKIDLGYVFNNRKEFENHDHDHGHDSGADHDHDHSSNDPALSMDLGTFSYNAKWHSSSINDRWSIIAGSQGMFQKNTNKGEEVLIPDARTVDFGAFVTSDYYYSGNSYWQAGVRFDVRSIDGDQFGLFGEDNYIPEYSKTFPSFNFATGVYTEFSSELSLRANLSSGFRAPTMFELLSNGIHEGTGRYETGNIDLKTEVGYQVDVSLDFRNEHVNFFANPFFNYMKNFIFLEPSGAEKNNLPVYCYRQTNAYLFGGEAGVHFHPHPSDWLHVETSYSGTFGRDIDRHYLPLMPSQKINSTVRTTFDGKYILKTTSLYVQYQYSFKQNRTALYETNTPAYSLVNVGVHFEFVFDKQRLLLNAGVDNLFDEAYFDHLSRYKSLGIRNPGRNLFARLTIPFGRK